jgi:hypothetical protein
MTNLLSRSIFEVCRAIVMCLCAISVIAVPHRADAFKQHDVDTVLATKQCTFCDLSDARLSGVDLSGGRLSGARLAGADLSKANLSGANVRNAFMHHARLVDANLSNADLSGADLAHADLSGTTLTHAKLAGADLSDAKLAATDLSGANLTGTYWIDGKKCGEGSIGECKKDSSQSEKKQGKGRGSQKGMYSLPAGQ